MKTNVRNHVEFLAETCIGNRPLGTLRRMWEGYIMVLLRKINCDRQMRIELS